MCLSNTTLFDGKDTYRIYYTESNYMFRHLTMAVCRLKNEKDLGSSYTRQSFFFISQPEDGHCQVPKHAVVFMYFILCTSLPSNKVLLDQYIHSNIVCEHNGNEPYDYCNNCSHSVAH